LEKSCGELGLECPDLGEIVEGFEGKKDVRLRVAVSSDGVEVKSFDIPEWHGSFLYDEVWRVKPVHLERKRPELKTTDTAAQLEARAEAAKEGFGEVLLVDEEGRIREGGITNVFFVKEEKLVTPGEGMLPGISRSLVLKACEELGVEVEFRDVGVDELENFDAVFLTNAIRGMVATGEVVSVMKRIEEWCTEFVKKGLDT